MEPRHMSVHRRVVKAYESNNVGDNVSELDYDSNYVHMSLPKMSRRAKTQKR